MATDRQLLSINEAARRLGVSRPTMCKMIQRGAFTLENRPGYAYPGIRADLVAVYQAASIGSMTAIETLRLLAENPHILDRLRAIAAENPAILNGLRAKKTGKATR